VRRVVVFAQETSQQAVGMRDVAHGVAAQKSLDFLDYCLGFAASNACSKQTLEMQGSKTPATSHQNGVICAVMQQLARLIRRKMQIAIG
jgi:hypothetical protein